MHGTTNNIAFVEPYWTLIVGCGAAVGPFLVCFIFFHGFLPYFQNMDQKNMKKISAESRIFTSDKPLGTLTSSIPFSE